MNDDFKLAEIDGGRWKRRLYIGDNLPVLCGLEDESVDLIYLDPPFNSKRMYEGNLDEGMGKMAFKDIWTMSDITAEDNWRLRTLCPAAFNLIQTLSDSHGEAWQAYLTFMAIRLDEMRRVLKSTGGIYLHCDWHMNAPLRLLMDIVFGADNFINEIVWCYTGGTDRAVGFQRKHDNILYYGKTSEPVFNQAYVDFAPGTIKRFNKTDSDGRKYKINQLSDGRITKTYMKEQGKLAPDYWNFPIVNKTYKESTGWATQKPLALLERIVKASSNEGDVVLDPFCGCGTACVAAEEWGRQWIGIDHHPKVGEIMQSRQYGKKGEMNSLIDIWKAVQITDATKAANLPKRSGVREIKKDDVRVKKAYYDEQSGKCKSGEWCIRGKDGVCDMELMDYDRINPAARGGYYTPDNVQLLCRKCNVAKGRKTWTQFIKELRRQKAQGIIDDPDIPR